MVLTCFFLKLDASILSRYESILYIPAQIMVGTVVYSEACVNMF